MLRQDPLGPNMAKKTDAKLEFRGGPEGLDRPILTDLRVKEAFTRVPREKFVPDKFGKIALADRALPIGYRQTISQPLIVALMTQEAGIIPGAKVLEVGTGSGYQAAILSEVGARVFTIEIIKELAEQAADRLKTLGYTNVQTRIGDGSNGWPEEAPFDAILVTAASPYLPEALINQLAIGGKLVIPIETPGEDGEELVVVTRTTNGMSKKRLGPVRFVPLTGSVREDVEE